MEQGSQMNIQWYPGHMTKTRRMIQEQLGHMDAVCEILDARIPASSRNPDVEELTGENPRLIVLNRTDLADPAATRQWAAYFRGKGYGKEFLLGMLRLLSDMGTRVVIQVSGQNYIARNLYKKTGFRTTESLSYYLY